MLVIGGGVAGLSAALAAAEAGRRVTVLVKDAADNCNTSWAQGGIAAAVGAGDSPAAHAADTLATGCGLCDPEVVRVVVEGAPAAVEGLLNAGAAFDREGGELALGREGGHGVRRILHAHGDATGAEIERSLLAAARAQPRIQVRPKTFIVDLLVAGERCVGVLARPAPGELCAWFARAVVLASGGCGRLYRETSNVRGATGDGIAAAFRAGVAVRDVEFVQFHPTTLYLAGSERVLITEAVRGEGAYVIDDQGRRFLKESVPQGELAPRDVVSRAIVQHLARPDVHDVFLDLRHLPPGRAARRFPGLFAACARYGLVPDRDVIPVRPAAHYFIGGVDVDLDGKSSLPGLWCCGEAACSGLHGANRLASNSLLEGLVLGKRVGSAAAREFEPLFAGDVEHRTARQRRRSDIEAPEDLVTSLRSRMWRSVGIIREAESLREALAAIGQWRRFSSTLNLRARQGWELENLLLIGHLVAAAAHTREESRGTHWRRDHPAPDDARFAGSFLWRANEPPRFRPAGSERHG